MSASFVHLRVHSEYSLIDGMVRVKPLIAAVRELGMPAVAVTDQSNLFALIKFYKASHGAGIKPVVGADLWLAPDDVQDDPTVLAVYARNDAGYRNLSELLSMGYREGQHQGRPLVTRAMISKHAEGLLGISGGRDGEIGKLLLAGKVSEARAALQSWLTVFPGAWYLELQRTDRDNEEAYIRMALDLAGELDCPVVATNDVRFLDAEEFEAHEVRVCIHEGRTLDDPRREHRYSEQQYLRTPAEMIELFSDIPEAIENTVEIARRCNVNVDLGNYYLPEYPVPEGLTTEDFFCDVSRQGLERRLEKILSPDMPDIAERRKAYFDRLDFELNVINNMGFPGYFLIVMEFIQWSKENDVPVGPGRGSGPGSLVAYALQITDIDPLEYDLLFERFLNPERVSLPDFDIDFCMDGRDKVIAHVTERYGREAVSQIITFGTMAAKAVVRDVARVQGKPYGLADKLSKLIPFDPNMTLQKAIDEEPLLRDFLSQNEDAAEIMEMAFKLEGLTRNVGKHAGGVVIAPTCLTDFSPVYCEADGSGLMTQFDKDDVEQAGLVKFDFLGLRTLTIIDNAVKSINRQKRLDGEADVVLEGLELDDPAIFKNLQAAATTAVFQLESRGMKDLMKKVKPSRFADIVALVALFRPGPMQLADDFIRRKHGIDEVDYLHPDLKPVLVDTYGVMLYQEQVMQIAQILAGYSLGDADLLRRAMGKKKPEEMAKQRAVFVQGATQRGVEESQADYIFSLMEKFAGYGFNKPHSVAYALIAYQTAWLKHHYPADFMAAVLSADMQTTDKVVTNIDECRYMGLLVEPPDVNVGEYRFKALSGNKVIYGLGAIKGLGEGPVDEIVGNRRDHGPFKDLFDLCERLDLRKLNKRVLEALIGSGALDNLIEAKSKDEARSLLLANHENAIKLADQKNRNVASGHSDLFGEDTFDMGQGDSPYNHPAHLRTMSFKERLAGERDTLGLYLTGHPMDLYREDLRHLVTTRINDLRVSKDSQTIAGLIVGIRTMKTRKGETIAFITLDDKSGRLEVSVFADLYENQREKLHKDKVVVVKGATSSDDFTGGVRMRSSEIWDINEARGKSARRLRLSLFVGDLGEGFERQLQDILKPYRRVGDGCQVAIDYHGRGAEAEVALGDDWRVVPDDNLIQNLREFYGKEQVQLDY